MSTACWGSRSVLLWRAALLDIDTGAPDPGASNGWVSNAVMSVAATPQTEAGDEFTLKNGDGDICQYYATPDRIKRVDPVLTVCEIDPRAVGLLIGGDVWTDGDGALGHNMALLTDDPIPVCLEWWTRAWDGSAQATLSGVAQYWHHVIPKVFFVPGAITSEHNLESRVFDGKGAENINITGDGPFDDWPATIATTDGATGAYSRWRESTLPTAACSYAEVTSAAS